MIARHARSLRHALTAMALGACTSASAVHSPATDTRPAIEVGTFNIRYANPQDGANAWQNRRALVVDILREGDVWGLQEALPAQVAELREALPEFSMVVRSRDRDPSTGEACPLLFRTARWSLDPDEHGTFWLSESPETPGSRSWDAALPRIATFARLVENGTGRALYVFNVHLDHRGADARLEAARLLARRIAQRRHQDPVVVLGDFNAGPGSPPLGALLGDAPLALTDAWRKVHAEEAERGTFSGWGESLGERRIDHVLIGPRLRVESCAIDDRRPDGRWPSDHAPVRATLHLDG